MSIMNLSSSRMIQHSLPRRLLHNHSGVVSIALFFVFCCVVFSLITSNFLTGTNWLNIIRQSAPLLIVATAMTLGHYHRRYRSVGRLHPGAGRRALRYRPE